MLLFFSYLVPKRDYIDLRYRQVNSELQTDGVTDAMVAGRMGWHPLI